MNKHDKYFPSHAFEDAEIYGIPFDWELFLCNISIDMTGNVTMFGQLIGQLPDDDHEDVIIYGATSFTLHYWLNDIIKAETQGRVLMKQVFDATNGQERWFLITSVLSDHLKLVARKYLPGIDTDKELRWYTIKMPRQIK
jgi:hypothetical protein